MIIATLINPTELDQFDSKSFRVESKDQGIGLAKGKRKGKEEEEDLKVLFDSELFDLEAAKAWIKKNNLSPIGIEEEEDDKKKDSPFQKIKPKDEMDEEEKKKMPPRFSMEVEILKTGTFNGVKFTITDLDSIVDSFSKIGQDMKPPLKLGHNETQKILASDGLPAAGWITELKRKGDRLLAKIINIPEKIFNLIENGSLGRFSSEIFCNLYHRGQKFDRVLKAVALLGADTPAVSTMDDLIEFFGTHSGLSFSEDQYNKVIYCDSESGVKGMNEDEKQELIKLKAENEKLLKLKSENDELKAKIAETEHNSLKERIELFVNSQIEKGMIVPANKQYYVALMLNNNQVKKFSYIEQDQEMNFEMNAFQLVEKILGNSTPQVDLTSQTQHFEPPKTGDMDDGDIIEQKIQKFMKEHNVSYENAFEQIAYMEAK